MNFLLIETASSVCSVAAATEEKIISIRENAEAMQHAALVSVFAEEVMNEAGFLFSDKSKDKNQKSKMLDAVVVSAGPGSYTGLRIGVSAAKGISYAANLPLIAVDTLEALANGFAQKRNFPSANNEPQATICSVFDARRDEIYFGIWKPNGDTIIKSRAALLNNEFLSIINSIESKIYYVGNGSKKVGEFLKNNKHEYHQHINPSASYLQSISVQKFLRKEIADLAYFEPNYIKPYFFAEKM
ncbi:MAG TPA: tRNA (adenosine(37)-N6)-threonylcarbamoyltransferase complex dimerization subunit type 1 TsaB [Bacteroidetes bacterium]|nr:tRNA (adenosine(37)-N6)-threonylcarbamoyltransferase complex dimerization subunit type 1 TsaB [Bacteroidota bacterium]